MTKAYVGLGSNLGDRRAHLDAAVRALEPARVSRYLETPALLPPGDARSQPAYLNAVAELDTDEGPGALLQRLRAVERAHGRPDARERWAARTLDLDLLLYGEQVIDEPRLKVPHPELQRRRFVLEPLLELSPQLVHPVLGKTVRALWEAL